MKQTSDRDVERLAKWLFRNIYGRKPFYSLGDGPRYNECAVASRKLLTRPPTILRKALRERKVRK